MSESHAAIVAALQAALPTLKAVYLFGSRATGTASGNSDYDVAFLAPNHGLDGYALHQVRNELASRLNANVDLVDVRQASTVLQFQIVAKGKRLLTTDPLFCDQFELFVYSSYQHLNEGQQDLLQYIKAQGKIHA